MFKTISIVCVVWCVMVSAICCTSEQQQNQQQATNTSTGSTTIHTITQITEKLLTKLGKQFINRNQARARGYDWGYLDG